MSKILIADEEKWFLEGITDRIDAEFGEGKYDFVFNGFDALELLGKNDYSMVILDMMMPLGGNLQLPKTEPKLMFGIYILQLIRERYKSIPIVCYTILDDNTMIKQIKQNNANYICKLDDDSYAELYDYITKYLV